MCIRKLFEIFYSARDIAFPEEKVKQKPVRFKHNPWMSSGLKVSQKRKEKLFSKKVKSPTVHNIQQLKLYNKIYNKVRRAATKLHYNKQFTKFAKNSKRTLGKS